MKPPSYDFNYARKVLKNIDEIMMFNDLLGSHDEVLTEYVHVRCVRCGHEHLSAQVIFNPFGYGTEGAVILEQHHSCADCGSDSKLKEQAFHMLQRVKEHDPYENLSAII